MITEYDLIKVQNLFNKVKNLKNIIENLEKDISCEKLHGIWINYDVIDKKKDEYYGQGYRIDDCDQDLVKSLLKGLVDKRKKELQETEDEIKSFSIVRV